MRLSLQLYTVRDQISADREGTLASLAEFGLEYIEGGGQTLADVDEWASLLGKYGLKFSGGHWGPDAIESNIGDLPAIAEKLGTKNIIVPWVPHDTFATEESIKAFADRLNAIGEKVSAAGLSLHYHNHDFELKAKVGEKNGLQALVDLTDPALVKFEVDVAWVLVGGVDPMEFLTANASRVGLLHVKDVDESQTPRWRVAGSGKVDLVNVVKFGEENGIPFGCIELDESPGHPLDAVNESIEYFATLGLK